MTDTPKSEDWGFAIEETYQSVKEKVKKATDEAIARFAPETLLTTNVLQTTLPKKEEYASQYQCPSDTLASFLAKYPLFGSSMLNGRSWLHPSFTPFEIKNIKVNMDPMAQPLWSDQKSCTVRYCIEGTNEQHESIIMVPVHATYNEFKEIVAHLFRKLQYRVVREEEEIYIVERNTLGTFLDLFNQNKFNGEQIKKTLCRFIERNIANCSEPDLQSLVYELFEIMKSMMFSFEQELKEKGNMLLRQMETKDLLSLLQLIQTILTERMKFYPSIMHDLSFFL